MTTCTPRVFIIRHGETEWSLNGRHTGKTDLPLTANGEARVRATGRALIGPDRLIVPRNMAHIYVSPRQRAQRTLELLFGDGDGDGEATRECFDHVERQTTEDVAEWDYGDYEGLTSAQINEGRLASGERVPWDIWRDGCPGGESPAQITARLDRLIADLRNRFHAPTMGQSHNDPRPCDVLIVAHGHILRAFAARWIGKDITDNPHMIIETGGVGTLSYEHARLDEPAILLGGSFMSDIVEQAANNA